MRTDGPLWASITAFGTLPRGTMMKRAGAKPGDIVVVTGTIGDGALGLRLLREPEHIGRWSLNDDEAGHLVGRYRVPQPRTAMADAVRDACVSRDGCVGRARRRSCQAVRRVGGIGADRDGAYSSVARRGQGAGARRPDLIEAIATGGDDYEILAAIPADKLSAFRELAASAAVAVTDIGEFVEGSEAPQVVAADGATLTFARGSFSHF